VHAADVASQIPGPIGSGLIDTAQSAFVGGMHTVAAVSAVIAVAVAALAWRALRDHGAAGTDATATDASDDRQDEVEASRHGELEPVGC
jgi:hypothetical protein